jgi:hypothetical protein
MIDEANHDDFSAKSPEERVMVLKELIARLSNQIKHLDRSQQELREALLADPHDHDFLAAVDENEAVLAKKVASILELHSQVLKIEPSYEQDVRDHIPERFRASSSPSTKIVAESDTSQVEVAPVMVDESGAGLYL